MTDLYVDIESEWVTHEDTLPKFVIGGYAYDDGPVEFTQLDWKLVSMMRQVYEAGGTVVMHRGAFETGTLGISGLKFYDTAMAATIAGAERGDPDAASHSLKSLAAKAGYLHPGGKGKAGLQASFKRGETLSPEQLAYLRADVEATREVYKYQRRKYPNIPDLERQTRWSENVFKLGRQGLRIDKDRLHTMLVGAYGSLQRLRAKLKDANVIQPRGPKKQPWRKSSVSEEFVQALLAEAGVTEHTDAGELLVRDSLTLRKTNDPRLHVLADYYRQQKWISLLEAYEGPGDMVRSRYNSLVATGRMSSSKPNVQQVPKRGGIRECWIPSPGCVLVEADYAMLELYTFSDTCARWGIPSRLRDALNRREDPHTVLAAETGFTRDSAKMYNYGCLGGMGAETLQENAEKQMGVVFPLQELRAGIDAWKRVWPEVPRYWEFNKAVKHPAGFVLDKRTGVRKMTFKYLVTNPQSGRKRLAYYCAAQNFGFQGPGGDIIKRATELGQGRGLPLVAALHDQLLADVPKSQAPEASHELGQVMRQAAQEICPNVNWPELKVSIFEERWRSK